MRPPLQKFKAFTQTLLPHETSYLLSIEQFKDSDRLHILQRVHHNAKHIQQFTPYDTQIDKRKYNHLKNWIIRRLKAVDVDVQYRQILDWEEKITTDAIQVQEEKELLKYIQKYNFPSYSFSRFYEVVGHYRHFLLIRLRYKDHQLVDDFLQKYRAAYLEAKTVWEKIHKATSIIVGQYSGKEKDSRHWEDWLRQVFYNEKLEGQIRFLALVRLVFIRHNYQDYDGIRASLDYLDNKFSQGKYYSKRLLTNYYNTRLMLHSHAREYEEAVYYGYLSIREKTHDHLFYVNNLCAVLLRLERNEEALQLMQDNAKEAQSTKNFHNRSGFVAFYMEALKKNGMQQNATHYGSTYLRAYDKEILAHRWHLFFSVYLDGLFQQGRHAELLRMAQKYQLAKKDANYPKSKNYIPNIRIYILASQYKEGLLHITKFKDKWKSLLAAYKPTPNQALQRLLKKIQQQVEEIKNW